MMNRSGSTVSIPSGPGGSASEAETSAAFLAASRAISSAIRAGSATASTRGIGTSAITRSMRPETSLSGADAEAGTGSCIRAIVRARGPASLQGAPAGMQIIPSAVAVAIAGTGVWLVSASRVRPDLARSAKSHGHPPRSPPPGSDRDRRDRYNTRFRSCRRTAIGAAGNNAHFRVRRLVRQRQDNADRAGHTYGSSGRGSASPSSSMRTTGSSSISPARTRIGTATPAAARSWSRPGRAGP